MKLRWWQRSVPVTKTTNLPESCLWVTETTNLKPQLIPNRHPWDGTLNPEIFHDVRQAAPGWDVYMLEREWRQWLGEQETEPKAPERHFLKFCKTWHERRKAG